MALQTDEESETMLAFADQVRLLPAGPNRPGTKLRGFHAGVVHETDNEDAGANAAMHYGYISGAPRAQKPSFHLCADADQSLQFLPIAPGTAEAGWHIGDGADDADDEAFFTIGGEICVNDRARFPTACRRMARSFAAVLVAYGQPCRDGVTIRQHGSYYSARNPAVHRGCPKHLKAGDWGVTWAGFITMIREEMAKLTAVGVGPTPPPAAGGTKIVVPGTNAEYWVIEPILSYWQAGGAVARYGWPQTSLYMETTGEAKGLAVQYFERARLEVQPNGQVTEGRLGAELLALRARVA
jgi:hypothetical protein